jgi:hypothetical protein
MDWRLRKAGPTYNYCCVADWQHYRLFLNSNDRPGFIEYETVLFYEGRYQYQVSQSNQVNIFPITSIYLREVDAENRVIDKEENYKKPAVPDFSFDKKLFDFSQTNREKILNRVKMIVVFT